MQENILEQDKMDKIRVLRMLYNDIKFIDNVYIAQDKGMTIIGEIDGTIYVKEKLENVTAYGKYIHVVTYENNKEIHTIMNLETKRKLQLDKWLYINSFDDNLIILIDTQYEKALILSKNLEGIGELQTYHARVSKTTVGGSHIVYRYGMKYCKAYVDTINNVISMYDHYELDSKYGLIALENSKHGYSINTNTIKNYKYALAKNGVIVENKKCYQDITRPQSIIQLSRLSNIDYFLAHDYNSNMEKVIGLIDDKGNEIITLDNNFSNMEFIGGNNFIVTKQVNNKELTSIYNLNNGLMIEFNENTFVQMHETLPLALIFKADGQILGLKTTGEWFNITDFTKYFKCYYSQDAPEVLKVDLDYTMKYITNRLSPIKNINFIHNNLERLNWYPI